MTTVYTNADFTSTFLFAREHRAALNAEPTARGFRLAGYAVHAGPTAARTIELGSRVVRHIEREDVERRYSHKRRDQR